MLTGIRIVPERFYPVPENPVAFSRNGVEERLCFFANLQLVCHGSKSRNSSSSSILFRSFTRRCIFSLSTIRESRSSKVWPGCFRSDNSCQVFSVTGILFADVLPMSTMYKILLILRIDYNNYLGPIKTLNP